MPRHPEVSVQLVGLDGNAFAILHRIRRAMRKAGLQNEFETFHEEATKGDYDHLLATCMAWFNIQ